MAGCRLQARPPRGERRLPRISRDRDALEPYLHDAAHFHGADAAGVATVTSEAEIAALLELGEPVLPIGAQSSLTGGATPRGEVLVSTARLNRVVEVGHGSVRAEAGVSLLDLDRALEATGAYYPPAPTFPGAFVGGIVATNAAGAATFKYGATRAWVQALTVVLPTGDVLDIERGATRADDRGRFELQLTRGVVTIPAPTYALPRVPKVSAGYFAGRGMDLIDLFIGSEGTLGIITEANLRIVPSRPAFCLAWVLCTSRPSALALVRRLRDEARLAWRSEGAAGIDVSAIEHVDRRSIELLREDGADRLHGVPFARGTTMALLITIELPPDTSSSQAFDEIGRAREPDPPDSPLVRFCRLLDDAGLLEAVEIAVPGDRARAAQLQALREAVPTAVNARVGRAQQTVDSRIEKTAADMIVPFDRLEELLTRYDDAFARRGLDAAVWGHISDGNLHPNVIPSSFRDVEEGRAAILDLGREVVRMGGSPLAEHGVGRSAIKQQLLVELYGQQGVAEMRAIKRAIDPEWTLAPGVLFPRT